MLERFMRWLTRTPKPQPTRMVTEQWKQAQKEEDTELKEARERYRQLVQRFGQERKGQLRKDM